MAMGPREGRVLHAMSIDDAYEVQRVLSSSPGGRTEVVSIDGLGPYLRKKIPLPLVDRQVWAALAECESPRLPHVVATYETPDEFVVVCDFVPADTISEVVAAEKCLPVFEAVRTTLEICEALENLHRHGIVHCDISPRNVLLAADGAHLIDLGIARPRGTEPSSEGPVLGTHGFAAPEQYGFAPVDERSDVYAAARLLGFMLTGLEPGDAYRAALLDESAVPAWLRAAIERGSAFEPSARYQTAAEFAGALSRTGHEAETAAARNGEEPRPQGEGFAKGREGAPRHSARRRAVRILATAACLVVTFVLGGTALAYLESNAANGIADAVINHMPATGQDGDNATDGRSEGAEGPSSSSVQLFNKPSGSTAAQVEALSIVESTWTTDGDCTYWVFAVRNNGEETVRSSKVQIVGRDGDGHVASSDYYELRPMRPGEIVYLAGLLSNGESTQSVDFVVQPSDDARMQGEGESDLALAVTDLTEVDKDTASLRFVGEVALESGEYQGYGNGVILVTVVLRNEDGELVGGESTTTDRPAPDLPQTFDTLSFYGVPYATAEAYAYEW